MLCRASPILLAEVTKVTGHSLSNSLGETSPLFLELMEPVKMSLRNKLLPRDL